MRGANDLLERAAAAAAHPEKAAPRLRSLIELGASAKADDPARLMALLETAETEGLAALRLPLATLDAVRRRRADPTLRLSTAIDLAGESDLDAVVAGVRAAAAAGADEIDLGIPIAAVLEGDLALVGETLQAAGEAAVDARLGAILGARKLTSPVDLTAVARSAIMGGAAMLVTESGATPSDLGVIATILAVLEEADGRIGLKVPAGPDLEATGAAVLHLADHFLGPAWASPTTLRLVVES